MDPEINRIISYWFEGEDPMQKWFRGGPTVDTEIRDQFSTLVERARASQLTSWTENPKGTLALLILLDQFPRNLFRGSPLSYSSDGMALDIATKSIAKGFHNKVEAMQTPFFLLPLVHNESLISQIAAVALYETFLSRCTPGSEEAQIAQAGVRAAEGHRDIIMRFGRFPGRNKPLGRISSPEEIQFLEEHPSGL
jgi:uncharacterized protein (DUF924 family)